MKTLLILYLIPLAAAFVPQPLLLRGQQSVLTKKYKNRDDIANEIIDLQGDSFHVTKTHDENPWKRILEHEQRHKTIGSLKRDLHHAEVSHEKQVDFLEQKLFSLYEIALDLTIKDLKMSAELTKLQAERNSFRKLVRRMFALFRERVSRRVTKVLCFLHLKKKQQPASV